MKRTDASPSRAAAAKKSAALTPNDETVFTTSAAIQSRRTQWLALSLLPNIGVKALHNLLAHFDCDLTAVFSAETTELRKVPGIGAKIAREIKNVDLVRLADEQAQWEERGVQTLTAADALYPARLKDATDHPPTIFLRGCLQPEAWKKCLSIVGTRYPSQVAKILTLQLSMKLARAGVTIVSGLALGIDAAAHASALEVGGTSIAVLGSGVLNVYPPQNRLIADRILKSGALLSEVHPRLAPNAQRLVSRNRIISALGEALIVVESDADGGAMHSARFARDQGRRVFTFRLPASGNRQLMRDGAAVLPSDLDQALGYLLS
ncbi:MAG: DNA-processing protein DprA [Chloroflexi bacterium]|nr:DNA-processing protein DprA [Chloroflexota bacterium]